MRGDTMNQFTIKEILENKINSLKEDLFEEKLYQQVVLLFNIWKTQKELLYYSTAYEYLEQDKQFTVNDVTFYDPSKKYKKQHISFLMKTNLIFLEEKKEEPMVLLNLIYYWILSEISIDRKKLS